MAFVLLWVFIDPTSLNTRDGEFRKWSKPRLEVEIDHQGHFRNPSLGEVYYEGGETKETKGSNRGTQICFEATTLIAQAFGDARQSLEHRIVLIDAVLHLGFRKKGTCSGRNFITQLESQQTKPNERRRLCCFMRTDDPQPKAFAQKENLLLPSGKLINTGNSDPFNQRTEKYADWAESTQVFAEDGDYEVQTEAPTSSDEGFQ